MAKLADLFRPGDLTLWGIVALVCGAVAVASANVSAVLPDSLMAGLHASRLSGASLAQLRRQVDDLTARGARLAQQNELLASRFTISEQNVNALSRRIGALEVSLPKMLEVLPPQIKVDTATTSSIGAGTAQSFDVEGGSVRVREMPFLPSMATPEAGASQPMPALPNAAAAGPKPDARAYGVAVGAPLRPGGSGTAWSALLDRVGPLLLGLAPLVGNQPESQGKLVAGPLGTLSEADQLCARIAAAGLTCTSVPFTGLPLKP